MLVGNLLLVGLRAGGGGGGLMLQAGSPGDPDVRPFRKGSSPENAGSNAGRCVINNGGCDVNAVCSHDSQYNITCTCRDYAGWVGDGKTCTCEWVCACTTCLLAGIAAACGLAGCGRGGYDERNKLPAIRITLARTAACSLPCATHLPSSSTSRLHPAMPMPMQPFAPPTTEAATPTTRSVNPHTDSLMAANAPATQASRPRTMALLAGPLLGDVHVPDHLYADDVVKRANSRDI